jgi:hypothetical protein
MTKKAHFLCEIIFLNGQAGHKLLPVYEGILNEADLNEFRLEFKLKMKLLEM